MNENFEAFIVDESLTVAYKKRAILKDIRIKLNLENRRKTILFGSGKK